MTLPFIFDNVVNLPIWGGTGHGLAPLVIDMRRDHGEGDIVEKITAAVDGGEVIALWDPEEQWPSFAIGRKDGTYYVRGADGVTRGTFMEIKAALKFGLTTRQEADS